MLRLGWICALVACGRVRFDPVADAPAAPADAFVCTTPYMPVAGSCYRVVAAPAPWDAAEQSCERDGAHLVTVVDSPSTSCCTTCS
jgi:hypothetical protein